MLMCIRQKGKLRHGQPPLSLAHALPQATGQGVLEPHVCDRGTAAGLAVSPRKAVHEPGGQASVGLPPTADRGLPRDSQQRPLPRQPGVWPSAPRLASRGSRAPRAG